MSRIVFMGTPAFSVPTLQTLADSHHEIDLVVTQPDRPAGRGRKLTPSPVKDFAIDRNLEVFQPENLKRNAEELQVLLQRDFDFLVVIAFGQILPKELLDHPKEAPLNIHASVLPAYRGAAPIARAIMEGEEESGVTIQWMTEELDMGDILYTLKTPIEESDTAESLHDRLKDLSAKAIMPCLRSFEKGRVKREPQDPRIGSYAKKLKKEESVLDFSKPAFDVHRKIMALNPWPIAECQLIGKKLRVFRSELVGRDPQAEPGSVVDTSDGKITVACGRGCVALTEVQVESKKRMPTGEFLKGQRIPEGMVLGYA